MVDILIKKLPKKTYEIFIQLAKQEFDGNLGMTLKYLVDYAIRDVKYQELSQRLLVLEERIFTEKKKPIKTISGKIIKEVE